jgi:hypothetical protein
VFLGKTRCAQAHGLVIGRTDLGEAWASAIGIACAMAHAHGPCNSLFGLGVRSVSRVMRPCWPLAGPLLHMIECENANFFEVSSYYIFAYDLAPLTGGPPVVTQYNMKHCNMKQ